MESDDGEGIVDGEEDGDHDEVGVQKLNLRVVQKLKIRKDQVVRIMIGYMNA